jgi:hypothetical protein
MLDFLFVPARAAEHQKDLREEAAKERMMQIIEATRPPLLERFLLYVGDLLIGAGVWLHRQYRPVESQPCLDSLGE